MPSIFTPPRTVVVAVGKLYVFAPLITPLLLIVIVDPSILTPPNTVVEAIGNVYCDVIYPDKSGGVYVNTPLLLLYDNEDVPDGFVFTERSPSKIPLVVLL